MKTAIATTTKNINCFCSEDFWGFLKRITIVKTKGNSDVFDGLRLFGHYNLYPSPVTNGMQKITLTFSNLSQPDEVPINISGCSPIHDPHFKLESLSIVIGKKSLELSEARSLDNTINIQINAEYEVAQ